MVALRHVGVAAVVAAGMLFAQVACAGFADGNRLKEWSEADRRTEQGTGTQQDASRSGVFTGYVMGAFDAYLGTGKFCAPSEPSRVTPKQVIAIVRKYVDEHPAEWADTGDAIVLHALKGAFPCRGNAR